MTDFDPARHKIVAVVTDPDDPDCGQHFHLSLPDLVQGVREIEPQKLPPEIISRIQELARHKIVAVVTDPDDPDCGQHFHLSLPDLVQEVREIEPPKLPQEIADRIQALEAREPTREIVQVETLPNDIMRQWDQFKTSQAYVLPNAFAELMERVARLESEPRDITPAMPESLIERIEALEDQGGAGAELYEAMANAMRLVADLSNKLESNKARADGQHGMVVDELSHLANVIRQAS